MIEMLGVLAIIGVLSVGGIAGYSKAMQKYRVSKTADQITQIINNTRILYANQTDYSGLSTTVAYNLGIIPEEIGSSFNFASTLYKNNSYFFAGHRTFFLEITGIYQEDCVALASMDWKAALGESFVGIHIGEVTSAVPCSIGYSHKFVSATEGGLNCGNRSPLNPSEAAVACYSDKAQRNPQRFGFGIVFR